MLLVPRDEVRIAAAGSGQAWMHSPDGLVELTAVQRRRPGVGGRLQPPEIITKVRTGPIIAATDGVFMLGGPEVLLADALARLGAQALLQHRAQAHGSVPDDAALVIITDRT